MTTRENDAARTAAKSTIRLWTGDCAAKRVPDPIAGQRVYATRSAFLLPGGRRVPVVNSWELLFDGKVRVRRGRIHLPEFDLEPTAEDGEEGIQLYALVSYDREGRENGLADNDFTLPADLGPVARFTDVICRHHGFVDADG